MSSSDTDYFLILSSALIRNSQGKILLLKRSKINKSFRGLWQLPEGKIHFGEQAEQALIRELKEELDFGLKHAKLFITSAVIISLHQQNIHLQRILFTVQCTGTMKLSPEHSAYRWFGKKQLASVRLFPGTQEILKGMKGF